jgi:hypothetical protein
MPLTKLSLGGNNLYMTSLFPPRESFVSDIPAGVGNIEKLFLGCTHHGNGKVKSKVLSLQLFDFGVENLRLEVECVYCRFCLTRHKS